MHPARRHLVDDHAHLERLCSELEAVLESGDRAALQRAWTGFEREASAHFADEEKWLFPLVAGAHPDDVEALRRDHARLRHLLGEQGLAADLRTLRAQSVRELLTELRAHAAREDAGVYAWLDEMPEPSRLAEWLDAIARRTGGRVLA
jgi:hemerythrin